MKKLLYIIGIMFLLVGCQQEDEVLDNAGTGYLHIEELTTATAEVVKVRTVSEGLNVEIRDAGGNVLHTFAEGATEGLRTVCLDAGNYTLVAYSSNYNTTYSDSEPGAGKYYKEQSFSIADGIVTRVKVEVPMTNIGVRFTLPSDFTTWFKSPSLSVTSGNRSVSISTGETAYLDITGNNPLVYVLTATNTDNEAVNMTGVINYSEITSGTIYQVSYNMPTRSLVVE